MTERVSIRFEVRGGFRPVELKQAGFDPFQSALRFAVVSDAYLGPLVEAQAFQSALRFAVVSDVIIIVIFTAAGMVSIRFEVRGGFRP